MITTSMRASNCKARFARFGRSEARNSSTFGVRLTSYNLTKTLRTVPNGKPKVLKMFRALQLPTALLVASSNAVAKLSIALSLTGLHHLPGVSLNKPICSNFKTNFYRPHVNIGSVFLFLKSPKVPDSSYFAVSTLLIKF